VDPNRWTDCGVGDTAFAGDGNGVKLGHDSGTLVHENLLA
jgi:hypothetical protein